MCGGCERVKPEKILKPVVIEEEIEDSHSYPVLSRKDKEPILLHLQIEESNQELVIVIRLYDSIEIWKVPIGEKCWVPRYIYDKIGERDYEIVSK